MAMPLVQELNTKTRWSFPSTPPNDTFAKCFIGQSYLAPLSANQVGIYNVTLGPGCRNNWHTHHAKSGGTPRYAASPDINTEDFCATVDFLSVQENVDPERIGIIGICGWGGMAINAASIDTRIKATAAMTMYDMTT